jgi:hypothetical protein
MSDLDHLITSATFQTYPQDGPASILTNLCRELLLFRSTPHHNLITAVAGDLSCKPPPESLLSAEAL